MRHTPTVLIDPSPFDKWRRIHQTRIPLSALRTGTIVDIPLLLGEKNDKSRTKRACRILSVNRAKQLILVEYDLGGYPMKETFRYVIEEEDNGI